MSVSSTHCRASILLAVEPPRASAWRWSLWPAEAPPPPGPFRRLLSEGVALGGRHVGLMSQVGRSRFAHLTDDEVAALKAFLDSR